MTEKNRKFELVMHGRIRKKPNRKKKINNKTEPIVEDPAFGINQSMLPDINQETWDRIFRIIREQNQQIWTEQQLPWIVPNSPQPRELNSPEHLYQPGNITWVNDTGNPTMIRLNSATGDAHINEPVMGSSQMGLASSQLISGSAQSASAGFTNSCTLGVTSVSCMSPKDFSNEGLIKFSST